MAKKFNPEKLNLQWCLDYDVERTYDCEDEGCHDEGICRCSVIENVVISEIKLYDVAQKVVDYLTFGKRTYATQPLEIGIAIIRSLEEIGADKAENYSWVAKGDYYGEIVGGIYFNNAEQMLANVKKILYK